MNILVTGGAGYLGSVLVPRLAEQGHRVIVLDNASNALNSVKAQRIFDDVTEYQSPGGFLSQIDTIVHLAALRLDVCEERAAEAFRVNTEGTRRLLRMAERAGVRRFIFASTCSNYGIARGVADEATTLMPTTIYAMTKTYAEEFVKASPIGVVLRFATLYGPSPNMRYDTIINALAREIASGGFFMLYDPDSWRPFLHVEDAAEAIEKVLTAPVLHYNVYNVRGDEITKQYLYDTVRDKYPDFDITLDPGKDARSYRVSNLRFQQDIAWYPRHQLLRDFPDLVEHLRAIREENYEKASR